MSSSLSDFLICQKVYEFLISLKMSSPFSEELSCIYCYLVWPSLFSSYESFIVISLKIIKMSNPLKDSLGAGSKPALDSKQRKMTQAIIEEQEKEKETYEFLEDDDDFEEFELLLHRIVQASLHSRHHF